MIDTRAQNQPHYVTVPFKVDYTGTYLFQGFNPDRCNAVNVVVEGPGSGTHVGTSIIHFDFCGVPANDGTFDFLYGDPLPSDGYIVADNGDSLFVTISGRVIVGRADDHPEYVNSYWRDTFRITGGTGRFEDATGIGLSDDYNSDLDPFSHHNWDGTITMKKGKRK
jgi:hypothetical protein